MFIFLILFLVSCGNTNDKGTISYPSHFVEKQSPSTDVVTNKFFDVSLHSFRYRPIDSEKFSPIEIKASPKFEYYQLLAGRNFLNRQTNQYQKRIYDEEISSHIVSFQLDPEKKFRSAEKIIHPASHNLSEEQAAEINIEGALYIDQASLLKANGIEVKIWDYYHHESIEVGFIPLSNLKRSESYKDKYKFNSLERINLAVLEKLHLRNHRILFSLRYSKQENTIRYFYESEGVLSIQEFLTRDQFNNFIQKKIKTADRLNSKENIHNLDRLSSNLNFYYNLPYRKEELERDFTYFRERVQELNDVETLKVDDESLKAEFWGEIVDERFIIREEMRSIPFHVKVTSGGFTAGRDGVCRVKYHILEPPSGTKINIVDIYHVLEMQEKMKFPQNVFEHHSNSSGFSYLEWNPKLFNEISLKVKELFIQKVVIGFADNLQRCVDRGRAYFIHAPHHQAQELIKSDLYKYKGSLLVFDIPWAQINWSTPIGELAGPTESSL